MFRYKYIFIYTLIAIMYIYVLYYPLSTYISQLYEIHYLNSILHKDKYIISNLQIQVNQWHDRIFIENQIRYVLHKCYDGESLYTKNN